MAKYKKLSQEDMDAGFRYHRKTLTDRYRPVIEEIRAAAINLHATPFVNVYEDSDGSLFARRESGPTLTSLFSIEVDDSDVADWSDEDIFLWMNECQYADPEGPSLVKAWRRSY